MTKQIMLSILVVGLVSIIETANGIQCYYCNAQNEEACNKGLSSLAVRDCPNRKDKCEAYGYELLEEGKVVTTGFQRGCLSEMGSCSLLRRSIGTIFSSPLFGNQKFQEKSCSVCESNLCNTE